MAKSSYKRRDRGLNSHRPVVAELGFQRLAEGSVLYRAQGTVVLVTASVDHSVPRFLEGSGKGWVTAEYQMHPRSSARRREARDGRQRPVSGRSREIERLIGRSLRAAVRLERLGERSITVDCDVLEADGGTRTACITAGFVALACALQKMHTLGFLSGPPLRDQVAAVSTGLVGGRPHLDLCYAEDSQAEVDLNLVATADGNVIEVQGTAEGKAISRAQLDALVDLALEGVSSLCLWQRSALSAAGIEVSSLMDAH